MKPLRQTACSGDSARATAIGDQIIARPCRVFQVILTLVVWTRTPRDEIHAAGS